MSVIRYSGYLKKNPGINPGFFSLSSFRRNQVRYVFGIADISDCAIPHSQKLHRTTCRLVPWVHRLRRDGPLLLPRLPASWYSIHSYIGSLSSSWFTNSTPAHRLNRLQSILSSQHLAPYTESKIVLIRPKQLCPLVCVPYRYCYIISYINQNSVKKVCSLQFFYENP